MNARKLGAAAGVIALIVGLFTGCGSTNSASNATSDGDSNSGTTATYSVDGAKDSIRIASGSENKEVSGAIEQAAKQSKVSVTVDYMGSLDVMDALRNKGHHAGRDYDAVWPASSMWITMGDIKHVVKDQVSTSTTPVVFGVKQSKAEELRLGEYGRHHEAGVHEGHYGCGEGQEAVVRYDVRHAIEFRSVGVHGVSDGAERR